MIYRISRVSRYTTSEKDPQTQNEKSKAKNHNLGTYETNKISLSCFDDKQYILKNGINTLAYGHKDIKMLNLDSITNENNKECKKNGKKNTKL